MYGLQNTTLLASGLSATGMAATISLVGRAGPILWDAGLTTRLMVQSRGRLDSPTSSFSGTGVAAHVTWPFLGWGAWQDPRQFGIYAGGEAQLLQAISPPPQSGEMVPTPIVYGTLAAEGGVEVDVGALRPALSPFPISVFRADVAALGLSPRLHAHVRRAASTAAASPAPSASPGNLLRDDRRPEAACPLPRPSLHAARAGEGDQSQVRGVVRIVVAPSSSHQASKRARGTPRKRRSSSDSASGTVSTSVASLR